MNETPANAATKAASKATSEAAPDAVSRALAAIGWDMAGPDIEKESFRRIETLCQDRMAALSPGEWRVARRLVHTTADPDIARLLRFAHNPIEAGVSALERGARIFCDSHMIRAGISRPKLRACSDAYPDAFPEDGQEGRGDPILCRSADPDVVGESKQGGTTRALCAVNKAHRLGELEGAIVLVGNAPLALARIARLVLEDGLRPALVVGMPVGFVNVCEAKELLALCPVPHIALMGRRGGSPLAVATLHALVEVVLDRRATRA